MYIKRKLESTILEYLKTKEIIAITGPRQGGKTTLLKNIQENLKESVYLTFENMKDLNLFDQDIDNFAKKYLSEYKYIFIDEFQYAKNGGKRLKYLYDVFPNNKLIISGSSAVDLTIKAIKFLVGRVFVFNLFPFDFEEFLLARENNLIGVYNEYVKKTDWTKIKNEELKISSAINKEFNDLLEEFIIWGGYPRVILAKTNSEKENVLKNIYNTYFLRDIKDVLGLIDDYKMERLIQALSNQTGQLINYNELGNLSGYNYLTLKKYLNILEKTFVCQRIHPFFSNKRKEIVKNPKIFFFDTGLRNYAVQNFSKLDLRVDKGQLNENFIFCQLIKKGIIPNFWRNKNKEEVDFVIGIHGGQIVIESKSQFKQTKIPKSLSAFIKLHQPKASIVASDNYQNPLEIDKTPIYFLPRWII